MGFIKMTYNFIGAAITLVAGVALIFSAYSYTVSPEKFNYTTYLSLTFPIFLAINTILLLFWFIQWHKIGIITLLAMTISSGSIFLYSPVHIIPTKANSNDTLSILTYNVHYFNQLIPHNKKSTNPIIEYIKKENADIVCIQEYAYGFNKNFLQNEDIDTALAKVYPYKKLSLKDNGYAAAGVACLSKYPITSSEDMFPESNANGASLYKVSIGDRELTLLVSHLESNKLSNGDRGFFNYLTSHIEETDTLIQEVKKRLTWKLAAAAKLRANQADIIASRIKELGESIIVCGDFNDTPQSYVYHTIRGELGDAYAKTGLGPGITYHADRFYFRIDHILYGKNLRPIYTKIGSIKDSDHYPVKALFQWEKPVTSLAP